VLPSFLHYFSRIHALAKRDAAISKRV